MFAFSFQQNFQIPATVFVFQILARSDFCGDCFCFPDSGNYLLPASCKLQNFQILTLVREGQSAKGDIKKISDIAQSSLITLTTKETQGSELFFVLNKLEFFSGLLCEMDKNFSEEDSDNIDWDTEDELEIQDPPFSSCRDLRTTGQHAINGDGETSSSSVPGQSQFIQKFLVMGFPEESIAKAIEQNGENSDLVLDALLTFKAIEDSPEEQPSASPHLEPCINSDDSSSEYNENFLDDVYEEDSWSSDSDYCTNAAKQFYLKEESSSLSEQEQTLLCLANMGYSVEEVSIAMERCGFITG